MDDRLLRQVGERIASAIGTGDIAAGFGGDEFVVLMTALAGDQDAAAGTGRKLLHSLARPYDLDGYVHSGSASIGLAYFRCGRDAAAEILKRADIAMYEAKSAGRNTLRVFDRQMQESVTSRVALQNDFASALQNNALHLAYQAQVSDKGRVTGVEALLRWTHPTRGPISPAEFIPVAESSGLIIRCGEWVLEQACVQLRHWEREPLTRALSIAVNVSAHQIRHPEFVDQVKDVLRRTAPMQAG
jgi:predicted signal transduction protein with EAL and GGDEF domain